MNKASPAWKRVVTGDAGVDAQRMRFDLESYLALAGALSNKAEYAHTDIARNAYREAAAQLKDNVIPVLKSAMDDIEQEYRVSREGAVDVEGL